jgi:DNA-binding transcriptional regulator YhcF (GntR family)
MTVSKAYAQLEREGLLERRPGLPLVVRALEEKRSVLEREDQLLDSLAPSAALARQLGISATDALALFRALLEDAGAMA